MPNCICRDECYLDLFMYLKEYTSILVIVLFNVSPIEHSFAQDLSAIDKKNPLKLSGTLGTQQIFYKSHGIPDRRLPYMWIFTGNLNINVYGLNIPISAFWSNQDKQFRQPFNQYGLSPRYKWVTLHLGYRNMSFSSYTLSGYTFLGAGVELTPGILRFAAMYGRLNKAVPEDTINHPLEVPAFLRMGYGFKVGVGKNGDFLDFVFFKAKDKINSIPYVPQTANILPAENLVLSLNGQKKLGRNFVLAAEFARSAYTRDLRSQEIDDKNIYNYASGIIRPRTSTQYFSAFKTSLAYNRQVYSIQAGYERIEPEYRTLGSYFFNNDMENFTLAPSLRLFDQRLNLNLNFGLQRSNVLRNKMNTTNRVITSVNLNFIPNQKFNFGLQYSNFTSYNKISSRFNQFQTLDTLNFYQINENASFNAGYNLQGSNHSHGVNVNLSYQTAHETYGEQVTQSKARFYNSNLGYRIAFVPQALTITAGLNLNRNYMIGSNTAGYGPTASTSKTFFDKKLRTTLLATLNSIYNATAPAAHAVNTVFNAMYLYKKHHTISLNLIWLNKKSRQATYSNFSEFTGTFAYLYNF